MEVHNVPILLNKLLKTRTNKALNLYLQANLPHIDNYEAMAKSKSVPASLLVFKANLCQKREYS
jgi:hypothetical protein